MAVSLFPFLLLCFRYFRNGLVSLLLNFQMASHHILVYVDLRACLGNINGGEWYWKKGMVEEIFSTGFEFTWLNERNKDNGVVYRYTSCISKYPFPVIPFLLLNLCKSPRHSVPCTVVSVGEVLHAACPSPVHPQPSAGSPCPPHFALCPSLAHQPSIYRSGCYDFYLPLSLVTTK